jgi:HSP20 family protein
MTTLVRWNRFDPTSLMSEFDRMFNAPTASRWANLNIAVDVAENENGYLVKASLPGLSVDDVEVTLEDNVLTLKGEMKADETIEDEQYHVRERRYGSFSRSIRFPMLVNGDAVAAKFENGVLSLQVPKAEEVKPRRITIHTN